MVEVAPMSPVLERVEAGLPPLLFLAGFAVYTFCAGTTVDWLDSGELLTGAHSLGVSHPPGQPLYSLLAKATMLLPAGGLATRGALLSGLASAAAWPLLHGLTLSLLHASSPGGRCRDPYVPLVAAATAVGFGLIAPSVFEGTRAEVYSLTLAGLLVAMRLCLDWSARRDARLLWLAALALGVTAGANPLLAAVEVGAVVLFAAVMDWRALLRSLGLCAAALLLGAGVYVLLAVRADAGADLAWGAPRTFTSFLDTASGAAYSGTFQPGGDSLADRLLGHAELFDRHLGYELALFGALGLLLLVVRSPKVGLFVFVSTLAALGTSVAQRIFYADNPDISGYLLLSFALCFAAAAVPGSSPPARRLPARVELGLALFTAVLIVVATPTDLRSADGGGETFTRALLGATPARAAVVARSDHAAFPLMYAQRVEGERPDVAVAIEPLFSSSWYLHTLKRWAPDVFVPVLDDGVLGGQSVRFLTLNGRQRATFFEPATKAGGDRGLLALVAGVDATSRDAYADWQRLDAALAADAPPSALTERVRALVASQRAAALVARRRYGEAARILLAALGDPQPWLPLWEARLRLTTPSTHEDVLAGADAAALLARAEKTPPYGCRLAQPRLLPVTHAFLAGPAQLAWRAGDLLWCLGLRAMAERYLLEFETPEAQQVLALHALREGDEQSAELAFARLHARARDVRIALALALFEEQKPAAALRALAPLLAVDDPSALSAAGPIHSAAGRFDEAERSLLRASALRPTSADPLVNLGILYARQQRFADAERVFAEASGKEGGARAQALLDKLRRERALPR